MTISTTRHSIEEDQCGRESSGHTPCHTLPAQKAKKISATERAVATPHATHFPHRRSRRRQSPALLAIPPSTTAVYAAAITKKKEEKEGCSQKGLQ
jgi:hypothetical protein